MRNPGTLPLVIPRPVLSPRSLLAAGAGTADSSRDKAALRNDNSSEISRVHRRRNLGFIVGLLCVCFSMAALAQVSASSSKPLSALEQTLIANTNAVPQAQKSKDVTFLKRTLTDDFVLVGSEGKLHDKEEIMESARDGELKDFYTYNLRVLPVNDEVAVVTYDCVIHMPEGDAPGLAPRYQHFSDVWVKQDDRWRLRFQQATAARPVD